MLVRFSTGDRIALGRLRGGAIEELAVESLGRLLAQSLDEARAQLEGEPVGTHAAAECRLLAPVDEQEVWAAGVTYLRSRDARLEESGGSDVYWRVYEAERPELFFKSPAWRVVGPDGEIGVRRDSSWNLPEPELAVIVNSEGAVFGYTAGNDVSSRSIEGANPLYLPQAKVFTAACSLGPGIVPVWELPDLAGAGITLEVCRDGRPVTRASAGVDQMRRSIPDLVGWLYRALDFPAGAVLLTGTGAVPPADFTLQPGDRVTISIEGIGSLRNRVIEVGS